MLHSHPFASFRFGSRSLLLLLCCGLCLASATAKAEAPMGKVFDSRTLKSEILGQDRKYAIYLPPDYDTSERSYPVLYLLHGAGDDQTGWVQFGEVLRIADKAIADGSATPMIIVMPDANTGQRGYFNDPEGEWRYEDFFFEELIPFIQREYRAKSDKQYRAVAGLSMGGGGTFMYALHHPEMFSSACPLSAYIGPLSFEEFKNRRQRERRNRDEDEQADDGNDADSEASDEASEEELKEYFQRHNAVELVNSLPDNQKNAVRWFIDCGDDDFLYEGNSLVHIAMRKQNIPHEYRVRDGGHSWTYWRESLPEVLSFVTDAFHQH